MAIKIYGSALSGRTTRVLAVLHEKEVTDFELVNVYANTKREDLPDFLTKQPFGQTPVLVDGSLILFESRAIARYVAEKFKDQGTALYGSTSEDKAIVEQWLEIEGHKFHPPSAVISRENLLKVSQGGQPDVAVVENNILKLGKVLDVYDKHLASNKYLAGDFFSMADSFHLPYIHHLICFSRRGEVIEARPHVKAWWEDISSRPAWKKVRAKIQEVICAKSTEESAQCTKAADDPSQSTDESAQCTMAADDASQSTDESAQCTKAADDTSQSTDESAQCTKDSA